MKRIAASLIIAVAALNAHAADDPARTVHDTYCIMCHDTQVYTRDSRVARDYDGIRQEVDRWQTNLSLNWSQNEIDLMTTWLARHYYKVPCPHDC
jgi:hypothetical protein